MVVNYRKIPGKNWVLSISDITPELQSEIAARVFEMHESTDLNVKLLSDRAKPIITERFVVDDRATLIIQFRSIHEHHQDYIYTLLHATPCEAEFVQAA